MSVRTIAPVEEQPETILQRWHVFETPKGTRHFCGYATLHSEGRVSSPVVAFDPRTMSGRTASGRVYHLDGPPGHHPDAAYVKGIWLDRCGFAETTIVEDLEAIEAASPSPGA